MGLLFGMIKLVLLLTAVITGLVFLVIGIYTVWIAKENPDFVKRVFTAAINVFIEVGENAMESLKKRIAAWRSSFRPFPRHHPGAT